MRTMINAVPWLLLAVLSSAAAGTVERELLAQLRHAHPATRFDRVEATPVAGLYEVWMGDNVAYVGRGNVRYLVFGHLFDVRRMQDLTASRSAGRAAAKPLAASPDNSVVSAADLANLPVADAITVVRGNGSRKLVVFTDPACGYCRQLDRSMRQLDDVTIHYFLLPLLGADLPEVIWCAADRRAAYAQVMAGGAPPAPALAPCSSPMRRNAALAAKLAVHATPTMLMTGGRRLTGMATASEIEARLLQASGKSDIAKPMARSEHATSH